MLLKCCYSITFYVTNVIGIIISNTGCCKQENGSDSYEQWEQPLPQCFYLYYWKLLGERFHDSLQICKVKFSRSSWFWKVTTFHNSSTIVFFYKATLTCLLIQAEKLWCRGRSFERSSKYKQIFVNSWVTNWKNKCLSWFALNTLQCLAIISFHCHMQHLYNIHSLLECVAKHFYLKCPPWKQIYWFVL